MMKGAKCILSVLTAVSLILPVILTSCDAARGSGTGIFGMEASSFTLNDTETPSLNTSVLPSETAASSLSSTTLSQSDSDALFTTNIREVQSKLLTQITGSSFTVSGNTIKFSYGNGKYKSSLPSEWVQKVINNKNIFSVYGFFVSPAKTAAACIDNNQLIIVYSNDKGITWQKSNINTTFKDFDFTEYDYTGNSFPADTFAFAFIDFPTADCGYAVLGEDTIMGANAKFVIKTTDGGKTWNYLSYMGRDDPQSGMTFINNKVGYIVETDMVNNVGNVSKTTDGGATWSGFRFDFSDKFDYSDWQSYVLAPYFKDNKGYLPVYLFNLETAAEIIIYYVSTDNGSSWKYDSFLDSAGLQ